MEGLNQPIQTPPPPVQVQPIEQPPPAQPVQPPPIQQVPPIKQTPPTQQTPPPSHSFLSKPLIILLVVFFLFAIFYACTYFKLNTMISNIINPPKPTPTIVAKIPTPTQTINPQADWKTYTSTQGSFSVQYPKNWFANQYQKSKFDVSKDAIELSDLENSIESIKGMSNSYTRISVMSFAGTMLESFPYGNGSESNNTIKPYTINSYQGIRGQQTGEAGLQEVIYLRNPKGGYAIITLMPPINNTVNILKIFDQILSTFKFLDTVDTSNWKTYTNNAYNFSLKYPSSYTVEEQSNGNSKLLSVIIKNPNPNSGGGSPQPFIEAVVFKNDANDLNNWLSNHTTKLPFDDPSVSMANSPFFYRGITNQKESLLGDKKAVTFDAKLFESSPKLTLTASGNFIIGLNFDNENETKDQNLKTIYPQILSTFKFL